MNSWKSKAVVREAYIYLTPSAILGLLTSFLIIESDFFKVRNAKKNIALTLFFFALSYDFYSLCIALKLPQNHTYNQYYGIKPFNMILPLAFIALVNYLVLILFKNNLRFKSQEKTIPDRYTKSTRVTKYYIILTCLFSPLLIISMLWLFALSGNIFFHQDFYLKSFGSFAVSYFITSAISILFGIFCFSRFISVNYLLTSDARYIHLPLLIFIFGNLILSFYVNKTSAYLLIVCLSLFLSNRAIIKMLFKAQKITLFKG